MVGTIIFIHTLDNSVGIVTREVFLKEINLGLLKIEISIFENVGCRVFFTATDNQNRRLWRTALTDKEGNVKTFASLNEAIVEAKQKINKSFKNHSYLSLLNPEF